MKLVKVDVDQSPKVAQRFSVQGIPTLLILVNAKVEARQTGAAPASTLRAWLEQAPRAVPS
jgi:thioredoxin 2